MKIIRGDVSKFEETIIPKEKTILASENIQDGSIERAIREKSPLTSVCEVTECLLLSAAPAVSPGLLRELGVSCVVNAASELPDTPLPQDRQVAYFKVGVEDRPNVDLLSHMDFVADMIEEVRCADGKTLVHCVAGVSRSATLCLAYLMKHERMPLRKAFSYLRSRRPSIRPNSGFFSQLIEFERRLFGAATVSMVHNQAAGNLIPDVYEAEYQNMLWYQQHYKHKFGRH
ncbi:dual specificity protein phosphatase 14 isoform X2 [Zootermopsis nevadensis]|uniref:Dual specificity protein phosphatase 14 n=1 Tax=Zootermopsis nevadensis TaxID=136037 RepID=A0A067R8H6_ZOONE|nr:dual specificity protein phosphatase 14 isoform X2 [Zootermopsis nevadensis]KDR19773.1 Dual specificity protein phosphatase 14 [Zootermopsis nevadensis]